MNLVVQNTKSEGQALPTSMGLDFISRSGIIHNNFAQLPRNETRLSNSQLNHSLQQVYTSKYNTQQVKHYLSFNEAPPNYVELGDKDAQIQIVIGSANDEGKATDVDQCSHSRKIRAVSCMKSGKKTSKGKRSHKLQCPRRDCTTKFIHKNSLLAHLELHKAHDKMTNKKDLV